MGLTESLQPSAARARVHCPLAREQTRSLNPRQLYSLETLKEKAPTNKELFLVGRGACSVPSERSPFYPIQAVKLWAADLVHAAGSKRGFLLHPDSEHLFAFEWTDPDTTMP